MRRPASARGTAAAGPGGLHGPRRPDGRRRMERRDGAHRDGGPRRRCGHRRDGGGLQHRWLPGRRERRTRGPARREQSQPGAGHRAAGRHPVPRAGDRRATRSTSRSAARSPPYRWPEARRPPVVTGRPALDHLDRGRRRPPLLDHRPAQRPRGGRGRHGHAAVGRGRGARRPRRRPRLLHLGGARRLRRCLRREPGGHRPRRGRAASPRCVVSDEEASGAVTRIATDGTASTAWWRAVATTCSPRRSSGGAVTAARPAGRQHRRHRGGRRRGGVLRGRRPPLGAGRRRRRGHPRRGDRTRTAPWPWPATGWCSRRTGGCGQRHYREQMLDPRSPLRHRRRPRDRPDLPPRRGPPGVRRRSPLVEEAGRPRAARALLRRLRRHRPAGGRGPAARGRRPGGPTPTGAPGSATTPQRSTGSTARRSRFLHERRDGPRRAARPTASWSAASSARAATATWPATG